MLLKCVGSWVIATGGWTTFYYHRFYAEICVCLIVIFFFWHCKKKKTRIQQLLSGFKYFGKRQSCFLRQYKQLHCLCVTARKQDRQIKGGCSSTLCQAWCATEIHGEPSLPFPNKQPIQTKEIPPPPLPSHTHTHSYMLLASEALSALFSSRFPSLSTHKAWERHEEEADVGARGSLELFWRVKVTETWHATWAKISSRSSLCSYWAMSNCLHMTMAGRTGGHCSCRGAAGW